MTRDEHTAIVNENDNSMLIFGGFCGGIRTNELTKFTF
jgi:hypothetical protein